MNQEHDKGNANDSFSEDTRMYLYRATCPPSDALGAYHLNQLNHSSAAFDNIDPQWLSDHLLTCVRCQSDLQKFKNLIDNDLAPIDIEVSQQDLQGEQVMQVVELASSEHAFRGSDNPLRRLAIKVGPEKVEETLIVEIRKIPSLQLRIRGEVWLFSPQNQKLFEGAIVEIWQEQSIKAVTTVEDGEFVCQVPDHPLLLIRITAEEDIQIRFELKV